MEFKLVHHLPEKFSIAVSGGPDSMATLDFFTKNKRLNPAFKEVHAIYINHGTTISNYGHPDRAQELVRTFCYDNNIPLKIYALDLLSYKKPSEADLRQSRYKVLNSYCAIHHLDVATCHTLDDCVEQYIIETLIRFTNNRCKVIPYSKKLDYSGQRVFRPIRTWTKAKIYKYLERNKIPYLEDPTNHDGSNLRSRIRLNLIKPLTDLSPGLYNTIKKIIYDEINNEAFLPPYCIEETPQECVLF